MMGRVVLFLVCRPDLPVGDPKALVAMLQGKPDGYSYGSPGVGTAHHLLVELIRSKMPFSATHVPYLGSAKAVVDLMEGRFDFMFLDATAALAPLKAGNLKVLAVTGAVATRPYSTSAWHASSSTSWIISFSLPLTTWFFRLAAVARARFLALASFLIRTTAAISIFSSRSSSMTSSRTPP